MVDTHKIAEIVSELSLMKYFPSDAMARVALVRMVCEMTGSEERAKWLVKRALAVFNEWPGPRELRALYCSRWRPMDGVEAYSMIYPADESGGGFPRDPQLPPAPAPFTPIGREEARRLLGDAAKDFGNL